MAKKLQLKISLKGAKPPIWRRIVLKDNISFAQLHNIIQDAMGWYNCHLWEFDFGYVKIGIPYEDDFFGGDDIVDARKVKINKYLNAVGVKINYNYDFGDYWQHAIHIEKVEALKRGEACPVMCIKGKQNCPPEDCGGIWGFQELVEKIKDENHPEHEEIMEWLGGEYNPEEFDIEGINQLLSKY